ncbi:fructose repressor fruR, lacI family [Vibrio ishigakensis]|uniref:Fructose repressor fruR, lacI family n=1 Tax=Vibrio ishigakensis TaxID=1481914 RepID=A0A0B8P1S1_9VIBR|nr:fructose repressor fruR, lacI family [Vibrio ishigakensis]
MITASCDGDAGKEKEVTKRLFERGVDGFFIVPSSKEQLEDTLGRYPSKPIVVLDRDYKIKDQHTVTSNNHLGFFELTNKLLDKKLSEVYVISGDCQIPTIRDRLQGFIDSYTHHELSPVSNWLYSVPKNTAKDGFDGMKMLMQDLNRVPKALVFSSLPILEGALHYIKSHTGVIPTSTIIGTFDDHTMLDFLPNRIVSVEQNAQLIAKHSVQLLLSKIDESTIRNSNIVIPTKLVSRNL